MFWLESPSATASPRLDIRNQSASGSGSSTRSRLQVMELIGANAVNMAIAAGGATSPSATRAASPTPGLQILMPQPYQQLRLRLGDQGLAAGDAGFEVVGEVRTAAGAEEGLAFLDRQGRRRGRVGVFVGGRPRRAVGQDGPRRHPCSPSRSTPTNAEDLPWRSTRGVTVTAPPAGPMKANWAERRRGRSDGAQGRLDAMRAGQAAVGGPPLHPVGGHVDGEGVARGLEAGEEVAERSHGA